MILNLSFQWRSMKPGTIRDIDNISSNHKIIYWCVSKLPIPSADFNDLNQERPHFNDVWIHPRSVSIITKCWEHDYVRSSNKTHTKFHLPVIVCRDVNIDRDNYLKHWECVLFSPYEHQVWITFKESDWLITVKKIHWIPLLLNNGNI